MIEGSYTRAGRLKRPRGKAVWKVRPMQPPATNDNQPDPFELRVRRAKYRAMHRGTKEADLVVGGFFDKHHASWDDAAMAWFEIILAEQDVDILAWAFGTAQPPAHLEGPLMDALRKLDFVEITR